MILIGFIFLLLVFAYPYLIFPAVLIVIARFRRIDVSSVTAVLAEEVSNVPSVTLIISAFNEEQVISNKLMNTLALRYPRSRLEVIVASDGSNDRTVEIVESYAAEGVRLLHSEIRRGKMLA